MTGETSAELWAGRGWVGELDGGDELGRVVDVADDDDELGRVGAVADDDELARVVDVATDDDEPGWVFVAADEPGRGDGTVVPRDGAVACEAGGWVVAAGARPAAPGEWYRTGTPGPDSATGRGSGSRAPVDDSALRCGVVVRAAPSVTGISVGCPPTAEVPCVAGARLPGEPAAVDAPERGVAEETDGASVASTRGTSPAKTAVFAALGVRLRPAIGCRCLPTAAAATPDNDRARTAVAALAPVRRREARLLRDAGTPTRRPPFRREERYAPPRPTVTIAGVDGGLDRARAAEAWCAEPLRWPCSLGPTSTGSRRAASCRAATPSSTWRRSTA